MLERFVRHCVDEDRFWWHIVDFGVGKGTVPGNKMF